jgi:hypothetical protein
MVKTILKKFDLTEKKYPCMKSIDFVKLENFVSLIINALIAKYGKERIKHAIQRDDSNSPIIWIFSYIIEVGGVKVIMDSHLENQDYGALQTSAFIAGTALNFALQSELVKQDLNESYNYNYYDFDTQEVLIRRIIQHVLEGNPESRINFEPYVNDMIKVNIFNNL